MLHKGCIGYVAYMLNKPIEPQEMEKTIVVNKYLDVFPTELIELPPERQIALIIGLVPITKPISRTPFHMALAELRELKDQFQKLLK
jgi:hypothetical protein